jgi:hypothetical protein
MRSVLVVASLLIGGCAHAPPWTQLTSSHFVLRTDLPPQVARLALTQFELTYAALETLAFASNPPRERIDFVLFRNEKGFRALAPEGTNGYFMSHQLDDPEALPTIAMFGTYTEATQRRFLHELTHRFMDHQLRAAPPWLDEGLAQYYSTMKLVGDEVLLGLLPNKSLFRIDLDFVSNMPLTARYVDNRIDLRAVPSVRELLDANEDEFHRSDHEVAYYFAAWTLVHMLLHDRDYRPGFSRYVSGLTLGATPNEAWKRGFGDVDMKELESRFRAYVVRVYIDEKVLRMRLPATSAIDTERQLRPDEVHLLLARIRPWDCRENIFAAGRDLATARALAGKDETAELHYWRALYAERWRHFQEAETELDRALAGDPRNERYWLALAELIARPDRTDRLEVARLDYAVTHLAPLAATSEALGFVARYYAERGDVALGLTFARRAAALAPDCRDCQDALSALRNSAHVPPQPGAREVYIRPTLQ